MLGNDAAADAVAPYAGAPGYTSAGSLSDSPFSIDSNGRLSFTNPAFQDTASYINQTAQDNNEWSAYQAQLDRDWQEYMSSSAHRREVADLQAAGLNPVLSAGGQGASTPSGAMGQTDTSNTRLVGELALKALDGLTMTAAGAAGSSAGNSPGFWDWMNKNSRAINTISGVVRAGALAARTLKFVV